MEGSSRILPMAVLLIATGLLAGVLALVIRQARSRSERFILVAVWFRYVLSAYHTYSFRPVAAGLTGQAIGSIGILALGLATIDIRHLLQRYFLPCFAIIALIALSGVMNGEIGGAMIAITKYGYFLVVAVSLYEALGKDGERRVLTQLLWAFAPLLVFQALSVALGVVKAGESDGSASYIGGYNHEAAFSVSLATCLLVVCLAGKVSGMLRNALLLACLAGIYLANYRTTILAVAPLIFTYVAWPELKELTPGQRPIVRFGAVMVGVVAIGAAALVMQTRMADMGAAFSNLDTLIKRPEAFNTQDQRLLSGRPYIWSTFIFAYVDGSDLQHVLGMGPESWEGRFGTYPHNSLIAYLYELGWVGVILLVILWTWMLIHAWRVKTSARPRLLAGHASFFLLNLATMPHWMVEGNIFYGILCGYTLYHKRLGEALEARQTQAGLEEIHRASAGTALPGLR